MTRRRRLTPARARRMLTSIVGALALVLASVGASIAADRAPAAPLPRTATGDLAGLVIVLDPGHDGGNGAHAAQINQLVNIGTGMKACDTAGTQTRSGYSEHAFTWDVARRTARQLRARGATVVLTRTNDTGWGPCITERAAIGNRAKAVVALSIHADGGPASGRGFHVIRPPSIPGFTDDIAPNSRVFARQLRNALRDTAHVPVANYIGRRGIDVRGDLGGLNRSDVTKCFVELGNMRNTREAAKLQRRTYRARLARTLADALGAYAKAHRSAA